MAKRPAAAAAAPAVAAFPVRRRLCGKQPAADYELRPHAEPQAGGAALRRPAAAQVALRRPGAKTSTNLCHGRPGAPCCFSVADSGAPARYHDTSRQCPWCNAELLQAALSTVHGKDNLKRALKFFWAHDKAIFVAAKQRLPANHQVHLPLRALGLPPAFHSAEALQKAAATSQGRGRLLASLRKRKEEDPTVAEEGLLAIPEEHQQEMREKLQQEPRKARQARDRAAAETEEEQWERLLAGRQRLRSLRAGAAAAQSVHEERVNEDRARVRRKFFPRRERSAAHSGRTWSNPMPPHLVEAIKDVEPNDTGLPRALITPEAGMLEAWCKQGSWGICSQCHSLEPRHLKEIDLRRVAGPSILRCRWCAKDGPASVPTVKDVPRPLRGLTSEIILALRPFEMDCGPYERPPHGYRVHTALLRLLWSAESVEEKIAALPHGSDRKKARKALKHLQHSTVSEYKTFWKQHQEFLHHNPEARDAERRRPLQQLEAPGVECALWPDLYWNSDLCETVERATDARRLARQGSQRGFLEDAEEDGPGTNQEEEDKRGALRRYFLKKVMGPIVDYAGEFELLQFVYDLWLWSDLGSKRHICPQLPMRVLLKGWSFTPAYWAMRHAAVLDLQRQCGFPILFKTWAPYEWSAPYHRALLREMAELLRSRQHLESLESLHLAHILVELLRGWVAGGDRKHGESSNFWKKHFLAATLPDGRRCRLNFAARLEFQDGKRRQASQQYHGRGALHLHAVLFAEQLEPLQLHKKLHASGPPEGHPLRGYVLDQLSYSGSGWPVHEGPSCWDPTSETVKLHHTETDAEEGVRAYGIEEMDVLKCHVDNLMPQAPGCAHVLLFRVSMQFNGS